MTRVSGSRNTGAGRPEPGPGLHRTSGWKDGVLLAGLCALALLVRVVYLYQIRDTPYIHHLAVDAEAYFEWSRRILSGQWLGNEVFYQAPLYPYFLALLLWPLGDDLWRLRVAQAVIGAFSCGLLFLAGKAYLSRGTAVIAALFLALYPPAIFFDGLIQKANLDLLLMTGLLWVLGLCVHRANRGKWLVAGLLLGLLGLTRENALPLAAVVFIWLLVHFADCGWQARLRWAACYLAGLSCVLLPVGLRNLAVGGEFLLTTSQMGPNFFMGNNPQATGTYLSLRTARGTTQFERADAVRLAEQKLGRKLSPGEVSAYWLGRAWEFIRSQPGAWLRLMGKKWLLTWNAFEIADTEDLYMYCEWSPLLGRLNRINHFGVICPLAVAGLLLTWPRRHELWLLYLVMLMFSISVAAFYVFARYRLAMVPVLLLFTGAAVARGFACLRRGRIYPVLWAAGAAGASAVAVNWPIYPVSLQRALGYYNWGAALAEQMRFEEAVEQYRRSLAVDWAHGETHNNLAASLIELGRLEEALEECRHAVRLQPDNALAHNNMATILMRRGENERALEHCLAALGVDPECVQALVTSGDCLLNLNRTEEALQRYRIALHLRPKDLAVRTRLVLSLIRLQRFAEALPHLRAGLAQAPDDVLMGNALARVLATAPDPDLRDGTEAVRIAEHVCRLTQFADPRILDTLASAYAEAGRFEEAVRTARQAIAEAQKAAETGLVAVTAARLRMYEARQPLREGPPATSQP